MTLRLTIIFILLSVILTGQVFTQSSICDKIIKIDSNEFKKNRVKPQHIPKTTDYKKVKNAIKITTKDTLIIFKDEFEKHGYEVYSYKTIGVDTSKKWVLIRGQDPQVDLFYLINLKTSKIDTLIGEPEIFGNKIICLESGYTDTPWKVQIWLIENDKIIPEKEFSLSSCGLNGITNIYLSGKTLFISNGFDMYWKAAVFK